MLLEKWLMPSCLVITLVGFLALSLGQGPEQATPAKSETNPAREETKSADLSKLSALQRQMHLSARQGADWLFRANRPDGRFIHGCLPALKATMDGDNYLRQAGAAAALAKAARYFGDDRYAAVARQALLTLLLETATDPQEPRIRRPTLPSAVVNRLAAAGLLVLAINELPSPGDDLLKQSEELCAFIAKQQRSDGMLSFTDSLPATAASGTTQNEPSDVKLPGGDPENLASYPGVALYGLMRSQLHRPASWKTDIVRKALPFYRAWWKEHKEMSFVPWHTAAYAEAFLVTRDQAFVDFINEMNDWMCELQYVLLDSRHPLRQGGFMGWSGGKPAGNVPNVISAYYATGLAEACRTARQSGDLTRYGRYRGALERCLQFLTTLQYTDANTQHFADWYRPALVGGFFASHEDGNLRIDYTQHAITAMLQYLACAVD